MGASAVGDLCAHLTFTPGSAMALVAVLGTTISPYLFFWQAALEVEDQQRRSAVPLRLIPWQAAPQIKRIRADTVIGLGVIALFIIHATAATLHRTGITDIQTSSQAAQALRPIAGKFAFCDFRNRDCRPGLLAVPVLAGSAAYALSEAFRWREGLDRRLLQAKSFYATIAVATMVGVGLNFTSLDPVKALYWSAVVNGILAAPVMAVMMLIAGNGRIMGRLSLPRPMMIMGLLATLVMLAASIGFFVL